MSVITQHHLLLNAAVNSLVGNDPVDLVNFANFEAYEEQFKLVARKQLKLIRDEFEELRDRGFRDRSVQEVRDGLGDVIVTMDGLLYRLGVPYTNVFAPALPVLDLETRKALELSGVMTFRIQDRLRTIDRALGVLMDRTQAVFLGNITAFKARIGETAEIVYLQVYALAYELGVDLAADQQAIYKSNMTKFDTDTAVAAQGLRKYENMGVAAALFPKEVDGVIYHVIKSTEDRVIGDRPFPAGKFLKSVLFKEPELEPLRDGALLGKLFVTAADID